MIKEELCPECGAERADQGFHYDGQNCDCGWTFGGRPKGGAIDGEKLELARALEQSCRDLNAAHDELMVAQGLTHEQAARRDWPEWSAPANTLRWAGTLLGKHVGKTDATKPDR